VAEKALQHEVGFFFFFSVEQPELPNHVFEW
jgi:hypothetical protein